MIGMQGKEETGRRKGRTGEEKLASVQIPEPLFSPEHHKFLFVCKGKGINRKRDKMECREVRRVRRREHMNE